MLLDPLVASRLVIALLLLLALLRVLAAGLGLRPRARLAAGSLAGAVVLLLPWLVQPLSPLPLELLSLPLTAGAAPLQSHPALADTVLQFLPWETEVRAAFAAGHLPLWSDLLDGGSSPWLNPQAGVLSVVANLARLLPLDHAAVVAALFRVVIGGQGSYLLARELGLVPIAAVIVATAFALGGPLGGWLLYPLGEVVAWTPWLALAARRLATAPAPRTLAATAAVFALLLLAGNPSPAVAAVLLAVVLIVAGPPAPSRTAGLARLLAGLALGFGIAAVVLLPFLAILPETVRVADGALAGSGGRSLASAVADLGKLAGAPLNPRALGVPGHDAAPPVGQWPSVASLYLGLVAAVGVALAVLAPTRREPFVLLTFGFLTVCWALAMPPLPWLQAAVPGLAEANAARFVPAGALAVALAAGVGFTALTRGEVDRRRVALALAITAVSSALIAPSPEVIIGWVVIGAGLGLAAGGRVRPGLLLLAAVAVVDLTFFSRRLLDRTPLPLPEPGSVRFGLAARGTASGPPRVLPAAGPPAASALALQGLADLRGNNPVALAPARTVLESAFDLTPRGGPGARAGRLPAAWLDFYAIRWVLARRPPDPASGLIPSAGGALVGPRGLALLENPDAAERYFLAEAPWRAAFDGGSGPPARSARQVLSIRTLRPGLVQLALPVGHSSLLATSQPDPHGWRARTDAGPAEARPLFGAYAGFRLPSEARSVTLAYRPRFLGIGALVSAGSLLLLAWLVAAGRRHP